MIRLAVWWRMDWVSARRHCKEDRRKVMAVIQVT